MALLSVIRRWHHRDGVSIRAIARRTGLSRGTVRKYLRSEVVEPRYSKRHTSTKLDPFAVELLACLKAEAHKGRKHQRRVTQLHAQLVKQGYDGSYGRVASFVRKWRQAQQDAAKTAGKRAYVPLVFAAGEAFQFDWSEDWAFITGERVKLQVAQFKLSHSRAFLLRAYLLQTHEMLFDAHAHAFRVFGGVPRRGIYDNMKTAVDRVGRGKAREVNARFAAMVSHYLYEAEFCSPASGWEKGQIEKNVQDARHRIWQAAPAFESLAAVNAWLESRCLELWRELPHPEKPDRTINDVWTEEQPLLMNVTRPFDGFVEHIKRVSPTCLVSFERNRYSVPASFANRPVSLRVYAERLLVVAEGHTIAEHQRIIQRDHRHPGRTVYDWRHYLSVLQRKPGALRNGAPFASFPAGFKRLQAILLKREGGDREMVEILALVLHHDEQAVLTAVELALQSGAASKPHILNLLAQLLHPVPTPVNAPEGLALSVEPEANVDRYDSLREARDAA